MILPLNDLEDILVFSRFVERIAPSAITIGGCVNSGINFVARLAFDLKPVAPLHAAHNVAPM